jgi:haloalkane dehalogenase
MTTIQRPYSVNHQPSAETFSPPRPAWLDQTVFPFKSRFIEIEGNRLHYIDEGAGPVILFLHGAPAWSFLYRNIIPGLQDRFRCIALDFPGFGLSEPAPGFRNRIAGNSRLIEKFIHELGLTDVTLYLHDSSASMGLGVFVRRPEWFKAFIISNAFGFPLDDFPSITRFLKVVRSRVFRLMINRFNFLTRYFSAQVADGKLTRAERSAYLGPTRDKRRRHHQQDILACILDAHEYLVDLEQRLLDLNHFPVLFAFGDQDAAYKAGFLQRFETMFPNRRSLVIKGADHFPQEDDPAIIVKTIRQWWDEQVEG